LAHLTVPTDGNVLVGTATSDDAGVYRINDELALIQTVDFFPPVVDDPYDFGRIAAANALSDVYAMGGIPKMALNIVAFPTETMALTVLREVLAGGIAKLEEAKTVLLGGHSVVDQELKYGLAVTGFVHPEKILTNQGLQPGDLLVLTKPLGTGIVNTAIKAGLANPELSRKVTEQMAQLNKMAGEVMADFPVSACTDVTGFGLLGHLAEMVLGGGVSVTIHSASVPYIAEAVEFAAMGMVPAGSFANRQHRAGLIEMAEDFDPLLRDILYDPQTSGGLLIGCPEKLAFLLVARMQERGVPAAVVGQVTGRGQERIVVV
jgi:selenide,water dikinase